MTKITCTTHTTETDSEEICQAEEEEQVFLDPSRLHKLEYSWSVKDLGNIYIGLIYYTEVAAIDDVHLSDNTNFDSLDLLHEICGYYSKSKLLEGFKHMLFTGSGLIFPCPSPKSCVIIYASHVLKERTPEGLFGKLSQRSCLRCGSS